MNESELKNSVELNSRRAHFWGKVLVAGLAAEVAILLAFEERKSVWETIAGVFAAALVMVSVWLELHFGKKAEVASAELLRISDEKIAEANARAAEANLKTEQEKLARVRIEERLAPRQIKSERADQMVEVLKPFAGLEFTASVAKDAEAYFLLMRLIHVFTRAGLVFRPWNSEPRLDAGPGFVGVSEISTGVILHAPPSMCETAVGVLRAFSISELKPPPRSVVGSESGLRGRLHLEVGKKEMTQ